MTTIPRIALWTTLACSVTAGSADAFEATDLPADNLVQNPWFRSPVDPTSAGFGIGVWTRETRDATTLVDEATGDQRPADSLTFGVSQKASNPSFDQRAANGQGCNNDPAVFCGTAARWAEDRGEGCSLERVGLDAYMVQVVAALDPTYRHLRFSAWWVAHRIAVAEVTIAGADAPTGPFTELWTPLHVESPDVDLAAQVPGGSGDDRSVEWMYLTCQSLDCATAPLVEHELAHGYAYYRIEIRVRYPDIQTVTCQVGAKLTGIYFSSAAVAGGNPDPDPNGDPDPDPDPPTTTPDSARGCSTSSPSSLLLVLALVGLRRRRR